jgi:hypothetical protein
MDGLDGRIALDVVLEIVSGTVSSSLLGKVLVLSQFLLALVYNAFNASVLILFCCYHFLLPAGQFPKCKSKSYTPASNITPFVIIERADDAASRAEKVVYAKNSEPLSDYQTVDAARGFLHTSILNAKNSRLTTRADTGCVEIVRHSSPCLFGTSESQKCTVSNIHHSHIVS